jgi:hypothetical protein
MAAMPSLVPMVGAAVAFARSYWILRDQIHGRLSAAEGEARLARRQGSAERAPSMRSMEVGGVRLAMCDDASGAALQTGVCYLRAPAPRVMAIEQM